MVKEINNRKVKMKNNKINNRWEKFIYNQIVGWGYSLDEIESKELELDRNNSPVIRIKFKNVQKAYSITRTFKNDRLIWVSHKKEWYGVGCNSCYTREVAIRPKINITNDIWDSVLQA